MVLKNSLMSFCNLICNLIYSLDCSGTEKNAKQDACEKRYSTNCGGFPHQAGADLSGAWLPRWRKFPV